TPTPSPFCHEILNANPYAYLDDAPLEERRARAVEMRRSLPPELAGNLGALDPVAIAEVAEESWPVVRDADELHDALLTLVWLPEEQAGTWGTYLPALIEAGRATIVQGWLESTGPTTAEELAGKLSLSTQDVNGVLLQLESQGQVLRGRFRPNSALSTHDSSLDSVEWCDRRLLARIHRLTIGKLR